MVSCGLLGIYRGVLGGRQGLEIGTREFDILWYRSGRWIHLLITYRLTGRFTRRGSKLCKDVQVIAIDNRVFAAFSSTSLTGIKLSNNQDYLLTQRRELSSMVASLNNRLETHISSENKLKTENELLQKEMKHLKKSLYAFQIMAKMPAPSLPPAMAVPTTYHVRTQYISSTTHQNRDAYIARKYSRLLNTWNHTIPADIPKSTWTTILSLSITLPKRRNLKRKNQKRLIHSMICLNRSKPDSWTVNDRCVSRWNPP